MHLEDSSSYDNANNNENNGVGYVLYGRPAARYSFEGVGWSLLLYQYYHISRPYWIFIHMTYSSAQNIDADNQALQKPKAIHDD